MDNSSDQGTYFLNEIFSCNNNEVSQTSRAFYVIAEINSGKTVYVHG